MAAHYPMPPTEQARWFAEEVHPHEPALRAYLQARFPNLADHDDLVQETYTRLLRAKDTGGVRYPKAFLFTAARNAAFDLFRRRRAHPTESINDRAELVVLDAQPSAAEALDPRYELEVLAEAVRAHAGSDIAEAQLALSAWLTPEQINEHLMDELDLLHPFGQANPEPIFGVRGVVLRTRPEIFKEHHFRFHFLL
jgi:DNA-directed RNA polymerase specialized sigma24 family protein